MRTSLATALRLGTLLVFLTACTAAPDLSEVLQRVGLPVPTVTTQTSTDEQVAAIKRVVQRANEEQAEAFAKDDPSVMRDTATAAHYDEMVQVNADLAASGVTKIELLGLTWGDVTVQGTTAMATTYETWRSTYADGSVEDSTDQNDYTLVLDHGAWRISSNTQPGTQTIVPGRQVPQPGQPAASVAVGDTSSNWAGYAATGGTFTSVSATWVVPQPSGTVSGADATWIGIGGVRGRDLIQAGTQSMSTGGGSVRYEAWIETLPQSSRAVPLTVRPGDTVTASVTEQGADSWLITIRNVTLDDTYATTVHYASSKSSAEWIEEAPSSGGRVLPLNDFGTVRFTDATAVKDGETLSARDAGAQAITMVNAVREALAQPSTIGSDGATFTVTRTAATDPVTGPNRRRRF